MDPLAAPKHARILTIQHDSMHGCTPRQPTCHYQSSTNITRAKVDLKAILTRVSYNDPNIVNHCKQGVARAG